MIGIIDYDAGNLKSVEKALHHLGEQAIITRDRDTLLRADKVILPGVGSFGVAMEKLHKYHLVQTIKEIVDANTPLLGICLGLQLLFEESEESPGVEGLSILEGKIVRIPHKDDLKIPHIGWNSLEFNNDTVLFQGISGNPYVYFVHSYYLQADHKEEVAATTRYGVSMDVSIEKNSIFACQFHPEKSGDVGLQILKNFAEWKRGAN